MTLNDDERQQDIEAIEADIAQMPVDEQAWGRLRLRILLYKKSDVSRMLHCLLAVGTDQNAEAANEMLDAMESDLNIQI